MHTETPTDGTATTAPVPASPSAQLASSVQAGPGVYALLVGSGTSVAAGVPTGNQVAREQIERLATSLGEDTGGDSFAWYRGHTGSEPDYRSLLNEIAPSQADRRNLLSGNFEPSNGVDGESTRTPTKAHRAIARLVADGYVRVIVTTNFDRLLETALTDAGVHAQVISSAAHAAGALPLVHSACTIIKVNGDYLSPDLKNTAEELDSYDPAIDKLLTQVFDEYGLIVSGWSAQFDTALRESILRTPNRRYSTYWMDRGNLTAEAADLVQHRQAIRVPIEDADSAFEQIADTIAALSQSADQQPQDTAAAVERLKLYMPNPVDRIKLHNLVIGETERLINQITGFPVQDVDVNKIYHSRMKDYEEASARLVALLAVGTYFSDIEEHFGLWLRCLEQLSNRDVTSSGLEPLVKMQQYPALLALYAVAIGAVVADRPDSIARVLGSAKVDTYRDKKSISAVVSSWRVLDHNWVMHTVPGFDRRKTPLSDHLFAVLRGIVAEQLPNRAGFEDAFDEAEYLLALACTSCNGAGPPGRVGWRRDVEMEAPGEFIDRHKSDLIEAGVFDDDADIESCRQVHNKRLEHVWWS